MASQSGRITPLLMLMAAILAFGLAEAQQNIPSCASKLVPCANYLNSTKPPASCCGPLKEAVSTELKCLCNLFNTPGLLDSFGVNVTQALQLTKACGVDPNVGLCKASASPPTTATRSPTAPPHGAITGSDKGNGGRITWTAISTLLLLVSVTVLPC